MAKIRIGLAGCGFVSELHMYAYKRVYGVDVEVSAVAARGAHVAEFARKHKIPSSYRSFDELIADPSIDVVDICTPPNLHASMIVTAMRAALGPFEELVGMSAPDPACPDCGNAKVAKQLSGFVAHGTVGQPTFGGGGCCGGSCGSC